MSVKNTFEILYEILIREIRAMNTIKRIQEIKFNDISKYYQKTSIFYSDEKLISLKNLLNNIQIIYVNKKSKKSIIYPHLDKLFEEEFVGQRKVFFKDFHGVLNSRYDEMIPFEVFKQEQYKINKQLSEKGYKNYEDIRYAVLKTNDDGEAAIIDAYLLKWNNFYYASNSGKSHRFSALCRWNEIENKNDSDFFNITEVSINNIIKDEFLKNYHGFLIDSLTSFNVKELLKKSLIKSDIKIFQKTTLRELSNNDITLMAFKKNAGFEKVINIFLGKENSIYINEYFNNII